MPFEANPADGSETLHVEHSKTSFGSIYWREQHSFRIANSRPKTTARSLLIDH